MLDIFFVLAYIPNYAHSGIVLLYDAIQGKLMTKFQTSLAIKEVSNNNLCPQINKKIIFLYLQENIYDIHSFYDIIFIVEQKMDQTFKVCAFHLRTYIDEIE